ncbi:outer membrane protein TOM13-domain-containing protein [Gamsiella multidivaricata]|uniref:outer membrane protein TOM13-domain-containing protein n=1 Tax=Gamsiella multidivaricata TaxID=101098 RepID=UPI00221FA8A0|nr:outer membrane protein TOM13-domain-containing protein [Gamsiella multidivaricata]KAI7831568.1 outer membrane protein TOM13-domain-containing protein [Gamsiella multidivaricata]
MGGNELFVFRFERVRLVSPYMEGVRFTNNISIQPCPSLHKTCTTQQRRPTWRSLPLNQTMPWKLFYPIISRETIISLSKATAINFILPFINGVFLGFGEICAHELTYRWGWTNSAHVVSVPGRRPANAGDVGVRAAGVSGAGSVGSVSGTQGPGYAGSRSGIGGLGRFEDEIDLNKTTRR